MRLSKMMIILEEVTMASKRIKPIIIKSDDIEKIYYKLCSIILKENYKKGYIISELGWFLDQLSDYMKKINIPNSYYLVSNIVKIDGFVLVDKNNIDKVLDHQLIDEYNEIPKIESGSLVYLVFDDEPFYLFVDDRNVDYQPIINISNIPIHLANQQIKEVFLESFNIAEHELDICSPWISRRVVNNNFIRLLRKTLIRNVTVKILYGLDSTSDEFNAKRSVNSDQIAEFLKNEFAEFYSQTFFIRRDNIHYKVVLCDNLFKLEGSYNYLSFDGEYNDNSVRKEGSPFGTNIDEIETIRRKYFEYIH